METAQLVRVFRAYARVEIRPSENLMSRPHLALAMLAGCLRVSPDGGGKQCSDVACTQDFGIGVVLGVPTGIPPSRVQIQLCRNGTCFDPVLAPVSSTHELVMSQDLSYGASFSPSAGCGESHSGRPALC